MSEAIKHECGIAMIRLLKPAEYYLGKYGSALYGLNKLMLLMEKQHNRGQDGAGIACIRFDAEPGTRFINRIRSNSTTPIIDVFSQAYAPVKKIRKENPTLLNDARWLKNNFDFSGELYLGHLRYGTFGRNTLEHCHPFIRNNNWKTRNLVLAGNFNLTNVDELFARLLSYGQHPVETSDTVTVLEKIGHYLDKENEKIYRKYREENLSKTEISRRIADEIDLPLILQKSARDWDGGYVMAGLLGHGDAFVMRDPVGIRPCYYYFDDEIVVAASERPVIMTAFSLGAESVKELPPGNALIVRRNGNISFNRFRDEASRAACSFERIYFSRGTDKDIYNERKKLGRALVPPILRMIGHDLEHTLFSYIPNTAAAAFYGLVESLNDFCDQVKEEKIMNARAGLTRDQVRKILSIRPRIEKIAVKDMKLRTFISQDSERDDLVTHIYDVNYGAMDPTVENLVVVDDSVVRGTTLRHSIIRMLDKLGPKCIIIASSAPQIRYPDCYGIDMARLGDFIAFRAAIALLRETGQEHIINRVYKLCKDHYTGKTDHEQNFVKEIYSPFTDAQIAEKITALLLPEGINARVHLLFQDIHDLHEACPGNTGDWYFTGNYPTPGGNRVVNQSFVNYIEGKNDRGYADLFVSDSKLIG